MKKRKELKKVGYKPDYNGRFVLAQEKSWELIPAKHIFARIARAVYVLFRMLI